MNKGRGNVTKTQISRKCFKIMSHGIPNGLSFVLILSSVLFSDIVVMTFLVGIVLGVIYAILADSYMYYAGPDHPVVSLLIFWFAMGLPVFVPVLVFLTGGDCLIIALLYAVITIGVSWVISRLRFRLRILIGTRGWV